MKTEKEAKISYWAAHFTTIISVTLVLLLIGIIAMVTVAADSETRRLKEKVELSVVLNDSVSDGAAAQIGRILAAKPYASNVKTITRRQALENWKAETGEDLEALFGVNPLSPEVSFSVKADYVSPVSIGEIRREISAMPDVAEVATPDIDMVEAMNRNIANLTFILSVVALVMIIISFVLINNTVHLTIYSRRFTIHTMQLVGARPGFIRRPFIQNNLLSGLLAGIAASALLAVALAAASRSGIMASVTTVSWVEYGIIAAGLIVIGALICGIAAWIATSRYLRKNYDQLFR